MKSVCLGSTLCSAMSPIDWSVMCVEGLKMRDTSPVKCVRCWQTQPPYLNPTHTLALVHREADERPLFVLTLVPGLLMPGNQPDVSGVGASYLDQVSNQSI